jgi:hypothetical protein
MRRTTEHHGHQKKTCLLDPVQAFLGHRCVCSEAVPVTGQRIDSGVHVAERGAAPVDTVRAVTGGPVVHFFLQSLDLCLLVGILPERKNAADVTQQL